MYPKWHSLYHVRCFWHYSYLSGVDNQHMHESMSHLKIIPADGSRVFTELGYFYHSAPVPPCGLILEPPMRLSVRSNAFLSLLIQIPIGMKILPLANWWTVFNAVLPNSSPLSIRFQGSGKDLTMAGLSTRSVTLVKTFTKRTTSIPAKGRHRLPLQPLVGMMTTMMTIPALTEIAIQ